MNRLLIFVVWAVGAGAWAQNPAPPVNHPSDAYWNLPLITEQQLQSVWVERQTVLLNPASALNAVVVQQNGVDNRAVLQAIAGSANRLETTQLGNGNSIDALLLGRNNNLTVTQTGEGNIINLGLIGNNNHYQLIQDGGDMANLQGLQRDNSRLELRQGLGNNSLTLDNATLSANPFGTSIPNLRIEQTGGATVTVTQVPVFGYQP